MIKLFSVKVHVEAEHFPVRAQVIALSLCANILKLLPASDATAVHVRSCWCAVLLPCCICCRGMRPARGSSCCKSCHITEACRISVELHFSRLNSSGLACLVQRLSAATAGV